MDAASGGQGQQSLTANRHVNRARRMAAIFAGVLAYCGQVT